MTNKKLWSPSKKNNLNLFIKTLKKRSLINKYEYEDIHNWSVKNKDKFWNEIWKFTNIIGKIKKPIIKNGKDFINSIFFEKSKLNYSKNLLKRSDKGESIIFISENEERRSLTWRELSNNVGKISLFLKDNKIVKGDRVAAVLPNIPETIVSFLGVAQIGAIWSSCSCDFGPKAIVDRFKQIKPKVIIISDFYYYNSKKINTLSNLTIIKKEIPSIKKIIIIPYDNKYRKYKIKFKYKNYLDIINKHSQYNVYELFDFNIPLYILYSSGTTGVPKCIVHGAGGSLIQHKKEHILHCDINYNDKVFFYTTCGWMMWNWLVSCLSSNATILLYDGSPFFPKIDNLFKIIEDEKITFFGTGAKYLDHLKQNKINIKKKFKINSLKTIASTGSPLVNETYEYIYKYIKKNVHLASISGGTDIVSCFVLGNPNQEVYSGEIQCKGLGMDVDIFNEDGASIKNKKGELVCKTTFPSKPLFFWKDKKNKKFKEAYFNKFPNTWHHGDYAKLTKNNGYIIYGRSDATLNSRGVRIGTAELYRVVENIDHVNECVAVEHIQLNDTQVILFVKMANKYKLTKEYIQNIKKKIKKLLSPKHVPNKIIQVIDIPKTKSGKIVELTVKKIINNEKVINIDSLENPNCLNEYKNIAKKII